jgi:hypothetical protein
MERLSRRGENLIGIIGVSSEIHMSLPISARSYSVKKLSVPSTPILHKFFPSAYFALSHNMFRSVLAGFLSERLIVYFVYTSPHQLPNYPKIYYLLILWSSLYKTRGGEVHVNRFKLCRWYYRKQWLRVSGNRAIKDGRLKRTENNA